MKPRRDAEEIVKIELTIKENQETSPELCITYRNSASNRRKINRETRKNTAIQSQPQFLNSLARPRPLPRILVCHGAENDFS